MGRPQLGVCVWKQKPIRPQQYHRRGAESAAAPCACFTPFSIQLPAGRSVLSSASTALPFARGMSRRVSDLRAEEIETNEPLEPFLKRSALRREESS